MEHKSGKYAHSTFSTGNMSYVIIYDSYIVIFELLFGNKGFCPLKKILRFLSPEESTSAPKKNYPDFYPLKKDFRPRKKWVQFFFFNGWNAFLGNDLNF